MKLSVLLCKKIIKKDIMSHILSNYRIFLSVNYECLKHNLFMCHISCSFVNKLGSIIPKVFMSIIALLPPTPVSM